MKMFTLLCLGIFLLSGSDLKAQGSKQTIVISNLDKIKGKLYIGWYNSASDFGKPDKAVIKRIAPVTGTESAPVVFENVPPGTYGIALFLDENDNGKMDTNLFGIPKERYGFSNNVYPLMRAANFSEASFAVKDADQTITIRLKS